MIHPARRLAKASLLLTGLGIAMLGLLTPRAAAQYAYPATKTDTVTDTYFGKTYADPYRWLENLNADDVTAWFKAQAELTDSTLAKIPGRDALFREWTALDKLRPVRYGDIDVEQGRVFYRKTLGGEKVGKLFYRDSWDGAEKLLEEFSLAWLHMVGLATGEPEFWKSHATPCLKQWLFALISCGSRETCG